MARFLFLAAFLAAFFVGGCAVAPADDSTATADNDGDGYTEANGDCDDTDASVNPGATEVCDDDVDNDCDGAIDANDSDCGGVDYDADGDGYTDAEGDCDDTDASVNPGATEVCDDDVDNDCDGDIDANDSDCNGGTGGGYWTAAWSYVCPSDQTCAWFEGGTRSGADFFSRQSDLGSDWCFPVSAGTEVTVSVGDLLVDTDGSLGCYQATGWDVYYVIRGDWVE